MKPELVELPTDLQDLRARLSQLPREEQGDLYARAFARPFAERFARLPLHGAPADLRPRALVSVLGLSWQPVALMAAWCNPTRMLLLGTDDSLAIRAAGEGVVALIARVAGISPDVIEPARVDEADERDVYARVRDFVAQAGTPARSVFVDPTGGKKSMSASAALAGFLAGAPLVYVDGEYDAARRRPVIGTEYPRLLTNPLEVLGDLELRDIFSAFNRGDFLEAARLAERLAGRLYTPREAECLARLARGYARWEDFDFPGAHETLATARDDLARFGGRGGWSWAAAVQGTLEHNLAALATLADIQETPARVQDGAPLLVWYLARARRLLDAGKPSLAVLLIYAGIERYVDLCLWVDYGLDDKSPDYARVSSRLDRERYDRAGRAFFGKKYRVGELGGPLQLANGAQLLSALAPERLSLDDLGPLQGLCRARNECEYEHGFLPKVPAVADAKRYWDTAVKIVAPAVGREEDLGRRMAECRFPLLS